MVFELPSPLTCKNMHMLKREHVHTKSHAHTCWGWGEEGETEAETEAQRYSERVRHSLESECGLPKKSHPREIVMAYTLGGRGREFREFRASLFYIVSSKIARVT